MKWKLFAISKTREQPAILTRYEWFESFESRLEGMKHSLAKIDSSLIRESSRFGTRLCLSVQFQNSNSRVRYNRKLKENFEFQITVYCFLFSAFSVLSPLFLINTPSDRGLRALMETSQSSLISQINSRQRTRQSSSPSASSSFSLPATESVEELLELIALLEKDLSLAGEIGQSLLDDKEGLERKVEELEQRNEGLLLRVRESGEIERVSAQRETERAARLTTES